MQKHGYVQYESLLEDDIDRRSSLNSTSPILDKLSIENFDQEGSLYEQQGAFAEGDNLEVFRRPIEGYEGAHRYDPHYRWTRAEEEQVVWKVQTPYACKAKYD